MPGVLVGVQRADSLTSSVQNNAALSVRDDNVEVSDRDTINVDTEDKLSGGESFEMVNADEAKEKSVDEEFPPIKELDYDESSSDDDEYEEAKGSNEPVMPGAFIEEPEEKGVSNAADIGTSKAKEAEQEAMPEYAQDAVPEYSKETAPEYAKEAAPEAFDDAFADLEPAVPEKDAFADLEPAVPETDDAFADLNPAVAEQTDTFEDDFANLSVAKADTEDNSDFFNNDFTNSNMPDFTSPVESQKTGNDEWEQLFAGFGNGPNTATPAAMTPPAATMAGDQLAVQELVGMGFDEQTAQDALSKMGGNLEAATNYLLDNA